MQPAAAPSVLVGMFLERTTRRAAAEVGDDGPRRSQHR
jgi:hypothetical protein